MLRGAAMFWLFKPFQLIVQLAAASGADKEIRKQLLVGEAAVANYQVSSTTKATTSPLPANLLWVIFIYPGLVRS